MGFLSWLGGIVVIVWIFLFFLNIGGWMIHILLAIAVVSFLIDLMSGKKKVNRG